MNLQEIIFLISLLSISPSTLRCLTSSSLVISLNQDYTFEYDLSHLILFQASCPTPLLLIPRTFLDTAFNSLLSLSSFLMMSSPIPLPMLCHKMKWLWVGWLGWSFNTDKGHIMDTSKSRYCPHSPLIGNSKPWNNGTLYPTTNLNVLELYTNLQSFEYKIINFNRHQWRMPKISKLSVLTI